MVEENGATTQTTPQGAGIQVATREQVVEGRKRVATPITKPSIRGSGTTH
jgi:hypothetical protein